MIILDTHVFLWWLADDRRLNKAILQRISDPAAEIRVSAASIWEISIKVRLGRLHLGTDDLISEIERNGFRELPVSARHGWLAGQLPRHHDDPFDRVLIAQARAEGLAIVTRDPAFADYDVERIPA